MRRGSDFGVVTKLLEIDFPGERVLFPLVPPFLFRLEFLNADGFGLVVGLYARRIGMFVVPDFFGRLAFGEEEEVGLDAGVGSEDAVGQADDGVQVALVEQLFLDAGLDAFAKERAVGQAQWRRARRP